MNPRPSPLPAWGGLAALIALLFLVQLAVLPKLRDLVVAGGAGLHVEQAQHGALAMIRTGWRQTLDAADLALLFATLAVAAALVVSEWRSRRYSELLTELEARPRAMLALVALLGLGVTRYYLNRGAVFMGDATMHVEVAAAVAEHFRQASWPLWSTYWYGGFPLLEFYAPLYFYVTGALDALLGDIHLATKLVLFACHLGSMLAMYAYLAVACPRRLQALVGALAYGLAFHHMHIILYRGDLHITFVYLLYPLLFLHLERYARGSLAPRAVFRRLALTAFLLIIAHHAYAFFGLVFFAVHALLRVACDRARAAGVVASLLPVALGLVGAAAMASFLLLPVLGDQQWVRGMPGLPFEILLPTVPRAGFLRAMLEWTMLGDRKNIGYLGISVALFALLGAGVALRRREPVALALLGAGLYALFTLRAGVQYNVKNMNFVVFYAAALAAQAPAVLARWRPAAAPARVALACIALLAMDLGPSTFQYVYREDIAFKERMYARIRALDPAYRTLERQLIAYEPGADPRASFDPHMLGSVMPTEPLASPFGWVHEAAGLSFGYAVEIGKQVQRELHDDQLSDRSLDGLYMLGVKYLTFRDRRHYFTPPLPASPGYCLEDGLLILRDASPLLAATRLVPARDVPGYDPHNEIERRQYFDPQAFDYGNDAYGRLVAPLLGVLAIDRRSATAAALPVLDHPGATLTGAPRPAVEVERYDNRIDRSTIVYVAPAASFAQLAFSWFPYLDVRIDGRPVPFLRSAFNLVVLTLPAGRHAISVTGAASPLRRVAFFITLAASLCVIAVPGRLLDRLAQGGPRNSAATRGADT